MRRTRCTTGGRSMWNIGLREGQLRRYSMGELMSRTVERSDNAAAHPLVKAYTRERLKAAVRRLRRHRDRSAADRARRDAASDALDVTPSPRRRDHGLEPHPQSQQTASPDAQASAQTSRATVESASRSQRQCVAADVVAADVRRRSARRSACRQPNGAGAVARRQRPTRTLRRTTST